MLVTEGVGREDCGARAGPVVLRLERRVALHSDALLAAVPAAHANCLGRQELQRCGGHPSASSPMDWESEFESHALYLMASSSCWYTL